jgi:glutamate carboxypeptidase
MSKTGSSNTPAIDPQEILDGILEWVRIESPSHDGVAVNRMVDRVVSDLAPLGVDLTRTPGVDGYGDILLARTPWGGDGPGILVVSHLDTVHPIGTIDDPLPVRQEGDKVFGPGIYDMKGGAYLALYVLRHLVRSGLETPLPITFLYVPEEEVGSPTSRAAIEREALANKYVLVTEPAREGGKIVTGRRGSARYRVHARGVPAHSGLRHQDGRSAIKEIAKQVLRFEALTDYEANLTCNVGLISGGTGTNVVPGECSAELDVRVPTPEIAEQICAYIDSFESFDPDVTVTITGGMNRPPYEKDEGIAKLFEHAKSLAAEIGFELEDMKTGGGSDGNFTAALGIPTLDGLGVDGHGAHQLDEHMYYSSLVPRTQLLLRLVQTLT